MRDPDNPLEAFDAVATVASEMGAYIRIPNPMAEGGSEIGFADLDMGQRLRVEPLRADADHGNLDIKKAPDGRNLGHRR